MSEVLVIFNDEERGQSLPEQQALQLGPAVRPAVPKLQRGGDSSLKLLADARVSVAAQGLGQVADSLVDLAPVRQVRALAIKGRHHLWLLASSQKGEPLDKEMMQRLDWADNCQAGSCVLGNTSQDSGKRSVWFQGKVQADRGGAEVEKNISACQP